MLLLEHEGKEVLRQYGIRVPRGTLIDKVTLASVPTSSLPFPAMVKAQVPVGGRGKAGGIRPVSSAEDFEAVATGLLSAELKGFQVASVLVEERKAVIKANETAARQAIEDFNVRMKKYQEEQEKAKE